MLEVLLPQEEIEKFSKTIPEKERPIWKYWPEFVEKYLRTGKSQVTVKNVRDGLRFAIRQLKLLTIEQLNTPRLVEDALFDYKNKHKIKNNTYNTYRKNFNTYFIWLEKMEYIQINKIGKIEKCKGEQDEHLTLNHGQVKAVLAHVYDRKQTRLQRLRNIFFIDLLRFTGARPVELLELNVKDITKYGDGYRLTLRGKKQKGRDRCYQLAPFLRDSFEAYMNYRADIRPNEEHLFVSSSRNTGWTYIGIRRFFGALSRELGFRITAYAFRRYVATRLYQEGVMLDKIGNYLGHTRITTTQRYIERTCALTNDCAEIMGKENI